MVYREKETRSNGADEHSNQEDQDYVHVAILRARQNPTVSDRVLTLSIRVFLHVAERQNSRGGGSPQSRAHRGLPAKVRLLFRHPWRESDDYRHGTTHTCTRFPDAIV